MDDNPFLASIGARLVRWEDGHSEIECDVRPGLTNRMGAVQGGVIATLIDVACGYSGLYSDDPDEHRNAVTITLHVSYVGGVREGRLRAIGTRTGGGRNIFFSRAEVYDDTGTLLASGQCAHKRMASARKST